MQILTEGRKEFLAWCNSDKELLNKFLEFRKRAHGNEADMDWWVKNKTPEELKDFMANFTTKGDAKRAERAKALEGADLIYNEGGWNVVKCNTYDAMKHYGQGTKWCISGRYEGHEERGQKFFNDYLRSDYTAYYVITDTNKGALLTDDSDAEKTKGHEVVQEPGEDSKAVRFASNKWCVCPHKSNPKECDIWCADDRTVSSIPGIPYIEGLPYLSDVVVDNSGELVAYKPQSRYGEYSVSIPANVVKIHSKLFMDNDNLTAIDFHPATSLGELGAGVAANSGVKAFNIPKSVTKVGRGVCLACDSLRVVDLESNAEIPDLAFAYCSNLETVFVHKQGTKFAEGAFTNSGDNTRSKILEIHVMHNHPEELVEWANGKNVYIINEATQEIVGGKKD